MANEQLATEHFWHAILLGCKTAEENYGLFQLAKQSKIPVQKAEAEMRKNLNSCLPVVGEKKSIDDTLFNCRCAFSLEKEKQILQKPYVLMRTEAKMAVLKDTQTGETMSVTEKRNLPNGANVLEVRKTAVILTYPSGEREILNLYKKDDCVDFCKQHNIQQNLSPTDMRLKIEGAKETVKIKPYHLTFTAPECEFISYYAQKLLPEGADYVGKEECKGLEPQEDAILTKVSAPEVEQIVQEPVQVEEKPIDALSISEKQRLIKASDDALKF